MQKRLDGLGAALLSTIPGLLRGDTFHYSRLETPVAHAVQYPSAAEDEAAHRIGTLTAACFRSFFLPNPQAAAAALTGAAP